MPRQGPVKTLSIGQISARTGLAVSAIRYYDDMGLISSIRTAGGNRRFLRSEIRKISFIAISQQLGISLAELKEHLVALPQDRAPTKRDWQHISMKFAENLNRRIEQMQRLRDRLDGCIGCGCLSLENCALYNRDDRAAKSGPGAQLILNQFLPRDL